MSDLGKLFTLFEFLPVVCLWGMWVLNDTADGRRKHVGPEAYD